MGDINGVVSLVSSHCEGDPSAAEMVQEKPASALGLARVWVVTYSDAGGEERCSDGPENHLCARQIEKNIYFRIHRLFALWRLLDI